MIYKRGKVFWVKYDSGDKPIREGIGMAKQKEAERLLNDREGCVAMGRVGLAEGAEDHCRRLTNRPQSVR
ncbi:hypothetical protein AYO43_09840 [Nitrospira sp. SCGC AG-212-E16]|nr:hypothetical protein AYO43_09840 [Nitrospira sp. SCGC AG-212-E16]